MYSRLNYLRFVLAWAVLAYHAFLPAFPMAGMLAVWCFFLISGFLVSNILYGRYNNRPKDFLTNRFLRIFPTYWTALFLGLCLVLYQADTPPGLPFELFAPSTFIQWWRNIFLFGSAGTHIFQWVVAPAGSLSLELTWYLILFVGSFFPRKWLLTFLFAMLTVPFILALHFDESIEIYGAGFAFSLGALAYHLEIRLPRMAQWVSIALMLSIIFLVPRHFGFHPFGPAPPGLWLTYIGVAVSLFFAMPWLSEEIPAGRLSVLLGELSYPLFVTHYFACFVLVRATSIPNQTWSFLAAATVLSLGFSYITVVVVERPISVIRTRIRNRA